VLNLIGYATRKGGDVDKASTITAGARGRPGLCQGAPISRRGYLAKGDVSRAKEQLEEIGRRCGGPCEEYTLLVDAIASHVAEEANPGW